MRKLLKNQLAELVALLPGAHENLLNCIDNDDMDNAVVFLSDCQNTAIAVGTKIDESEGEGTTTVKALEAYCELLYHIHQDQLFDKLLLFHLFLHKAFVPYHDI